MDTPRLRQLRTFADILDTRFRGPFGLRFGVDAVLGLVPVLGDMVTATMSFFILAEATTLGASPSVLLRMLLNVIVENVIAVIPVLGNVFDFFWKSNTRNLRILESHLANPRSAQVRSRIFNIIFIASLVLILIAGMVGSFYLLKFIFAWAMNLYESMRSTQW